MTTDIQSYLKKHLWELHSDMEYNEVGIKIHTYKFSIEKGYRYIKYSIIKDTGRFRKFTTVLSFSELELIETAYRRNEKITLLCK